MGIEPGRIWIAGADGLVGSHLCRDLRTHGWGRTALNITDAAEIAAVLDSGSPQVVINAAAQANVNRADLDPEHTMMVNGTGPALLAEACSKRGIRLVHLSTDYVLTGPDIPGCLLREDHPTDPRSIYARSKLVGEQAVLSSGHTVVRIQWVYRPGFRGFFTTAMQRLARQESLALVMDQIGAPTPSFVVAEGLLAVAEGDSCGLFQLACDGQTSAYGWIRAGADCFNLPFDVQQIQRADLTGAERPARSVLDTGKLQSHFGFQPPSWRDAMVRAIEMEGWHPLG